MNLLLDTVTFLWLIEDAPNVSADARAALMDDENPLFLSVASSWEIGVKYRAGKLRLPLPPARLVPQQRKLRGIEPLAVIEAAALRLPQLPQFHRDPFDRMLVCQAIEHGMTIVTPDELIRAYPVQTLW